MLATPFLRRAVRATLILGVLLSPIPASACMPFFESPRTTAQRWEEAKQAVGRAYAIIDAEVVRTGGYDEGPALLYAHRVLKGPQERWFEVGTNGRDSCARQFPHVGERQRLFVFKSDKGLFVADAFVDAYYVDRILRSKRKRDFPYFPGVRSELPEVAR